MILSNKKFTKNEYYVFVKQHRTFLDNFLNIINKIKYNFYGFSYTLINL